MVSISIFSRDFRFSISCSISIMISVVILNIYNIGTLEKKRDEMRYAARCDMIYEM